MDKGRGMTWGGVCIHITLPHWCLKIFPLYTHFCEMVHSPCIPPRGWDSKTPTLQDKSMLSGYRAKDKGGWDSWKGAFRSDQISRSVVSDSLRPHKSQHTRPPCPSPTPRVHSNSRPSSPWCHPAISSSAIPFSSCPQSLPASALEGIKERRWGEERPSPYVGWPYFSFSSFLAWSGKSLSYRPQQTHPLLALLTLGLNKQAKITHVHTHPLEVCDQ